MLFTAGEVWSILAKQRHWNLRTNPSDPCRHCWIGNLLCSYICTLQGIYTYIYLLYTLKLKGWLFFPLLSHLFLPYYHQPLSCHLVLFRPFASCLTCMPFSFTSYSLSPLPLLHSSPLFPSSSTEHWDFYRVLYFPDYMKFCKLMQSSHHEKPEY